MHYSPLPRGEGRLRVSNLRASLTDNQRRVLALALCQPLRSHPIVGAIEKRYIVIVHVLIAHKSARQLAWLERPLGMGGNVMGILIEIGVDEIDSFVFGVVISLPLFRRQFRRHNFAPAIERGRNDVRAFLEPKAD